MVEDVSDCLERVRKCSSHFQKWARILVKMLDARLILLLVHFGDSSKLDSCTRFRYVLKNV